MGYPTEEKHDKERFYRRLQDPLYITNVSQVFLISNKGVLPWTLKQSVNRNNEKWHNSTFLQKAGTIIRSDANRWDPD